MVLFFEKSEISCWNHVEISLKSELVLHAAYPILAVFAQQFTGTHLNSWVEIVTSGVKHSAQEHNTAAFLYFKYCIVYNC